MLPALDLCATPEDEDCDGAQQPCTDDPPWSVGFGGTVIDGFGNLAIDPSGNVYTTLTANNYDFGMGPVPGHVLVKLDPSGSLLWAKPFEFMRSIATGGDGNVAFAATFTNVNLGCAVVFGSQFVYGKLDPNGNCLWAHAFDTNVASASVASDAAGNVFIGGNFGSADFGGGLLSGHVVAKLDAAGNHAWSQNVGNADRIVADGAGNLTYVGGGVALHFGRLDPSGAPIFQKTIGPGPTFAESRCATNLQGEVFFTGLYGGSVDFGGGPLPLPDGVYLAKLDANGNHVFSRSLPVEIGIGPVIAGSAAGDAIVTVTFSGIMNYGGAYLESESPKDLFVIRYDPTGSPKWGRTFGGGGFDIGIGIEMSPLGSPVLAGRFESTIDFGQGPIMPGGTFIAKLEP